MYPGADKVGCILLARAHAAPAGRVPRFAPAYGVSKGADEVAPFEDGPVRVTVERRVRAVGGLLTGDDAEGAIWLGVDPPVPRSGEWDPVNASHDREERPPHLRGLVEVLRRRSLLRQPVAVADVAYPNGADPALIEVLRAWDGLARLGAYGAWNTAGNTIGTIVAHASAAADASTAEQRTARERFLLHRFTEDWGYQRVVRAQLRNWLTAETSVAEPTDAHLTTATDWIEPRLNEAIAELSIFVGRCCVASGSVRHPWSRTFEVDFDIEPVGDRRSPP